MEVTQYNDINLIYKYYSPSEHNLDALINRYFWFAKKDFLNDPFDLGNFKKGRNLSLYVNLHQSLSKGDLNETTIKQFIKEYACCSFTKSELDKQMWAYYAKDYSGWCLAFRREEQNVAKDIPLYPVIYVNSDLKPINHIDETLYGTDSPEDGIRKLLCTKHESWQHEQEMRMLIKMKSTNMGKKHCWGTYSLHHITIGHKISPAFENIITTIAKGMQVKVYKIDVNRTDFQLDKKLIT